MQANFFIKVQQLLYIGFAIRLEKIISEILTIFKRGVDELCREDRIKSFEKLDRLREARKMSFYELGIKLGYPNSMFSEWKSGKSMPKTDKLLKIAEYFGVSVDYFIDV